jgi:magnesium-transporting ATPase (P-type)
MILLSTLLRFWQEFRSNKAAEVLKAMVTSTAAVLRARWRSTVAITPSSIRPVAVPTA